MPCFVQLNTWQFYPMLEAFCCKTVKTQNILKIHRSGCRVQNEYKRNKKESAEEPLTEGIAVTQTNVMAALPGVMPMERKRAVPLYF